MPQICSWVHFVYNLWQCCLISTFSLQVLMLTYTVYTLNRADYLSITANDYILWHSVTWSATCKHAISRNRHCGLDITKEVRSYQVLLLVLWAWDSWWSGLLTKVGRGYLLKYSKLSRVYPAIVNTGEVNNHDNCWDFLENNSCTCTMTNWRRL